MNTQTKQALRVATEDYDARVFFNLIKDLERDDRYSALHELVKSNYYPFVERLGSYFEVDFSFMNSKCLFTAIDSGYPEMMEILCGAGGCDPEARSGGPLKRACCVGFTQGVEVLLAFGANPEKDAVAFSQACARNYLTIVKAILDKYPKCSRLQRAIGAYYAIINNNEAILLANIRAGASMHKYHEQAALKTNNQRIINIVNKARKNP